MDPAGILEFGSSTLSTTNTDYLQGISKQNYEDDEDDSQSESPAPQALMDDDDKDFIDMEGTPLDSPSDVNGRVEVPEYFREFLIWAVLESVGQSTKLSPKTETEMNRVFFAVKDVIEQKYDKGSRFGIFWASLSHYKTVTVEKITTIPTDEVCALDGQPLKRPVFQVTMHSPALQQCIYVNENYKRFVELCFNFRRPALCLKARCKQELERRGDTETSKKSMVSYEKNYEWFLEQYEFQKSLKVYMTNTLRLLT